MGVWDAFDHGEYGSVGCGRAWSVWEFGMYWTMSVEYT